MRAGRSLPRTWAIVRPPFASDGLDMIVIAPWTTSWKPPATGGRPDSGWPASIESR